MEETSMSNIYSTLSAKINDNLANDPDYTRLNATAEQCKSVFTEVAASLPGLRKMNAGSCKTPEDFARYMCAGSTHQYYAEEYQDDIQDLMYRARKHAAFGETKDAEQTQRAAEQLKAVDGEYKLFFDSALSERANEALRTIDRLHAHMVNRLQEVTRETIKQNYYSKGVQEVFNAVEKGVDGGAGDRLESVIKKEVQNFIAARDYQIPPRSATLKR